MSNFIESANSRETSVELMDAILYVADKNEAQAVRIWEEPTQAEALAIWERVTKNGLLDSADFCWGAAGSRWAEAMGVAVDTGTQAYNHELLLSGAQGIVEFQRALEIAKNACVAEELDEALGWGILEFSDGSKLSVGIEDRVARVYSEADGAEYKRWAAANVVAQ